MSEVKPQLETERAGNGDNSGLPPRITLPIPSWMPHDLPDRPMPNDNDIYSILDAWALAMYPRILEAHIHKGGWEGWAQTEIAVAIAAQYKTIQVLREQSIYVGNTRRADIVLRESGHTTHIIELKTLSLYTMETYGKYSFVQGFIRDIEKVVDNDLKDGYAPAQLHAVGLCCVKPANDWALNRLVKKGYGHSANGVSIAGAGTDEELVRWSFDCNWNTAADSERAKMVFT